MDNTFQDVDGYSGFGVSPDGLGGPFGDTALQPQVAVVPANPLRGVLMAFWSLASVAGAAVGAYHGYKRNDSVGWAIGWSLLGGIAPIIVIPVALAQGIGERKRRERE